MRIAVLALLVLTTAASPLRELMTRSFRDSVYASHLRPEVRAKAQKLVSYLRLPSERQRFKTQDHNENNTAYYQCLADKEKAFEAFLTSPECQELDKLMGSTCEHSDITTCKSDSKCAPDWFCESSGSSCYDDAVQDPAVCNSTAHCEYTDFGSGIGWCGMNMTDPPPTCYDKEDEAICSSTTGCTVSFYGCAERATSEFLGKICPTQCFKNLVLAFLEIMECEELASDSAFGGLGMSQLMASQLALMCMRRDKNQYCLPLKFDPATNKPTRAYDSAVKVPEAAFKALFGENITMSELVNDTEVYRGSFMCYDLNELGCCANSQREFEILLNEVVFSGATISETWNFTAYNAIVKEYFATTQQTCALCTGECGNPFAESFEVDLDLVVNSTLNKTGLDHFRLDIMDYLDVDVNSTSQIPCTTISETGTRRRNSAEKIQVTIRASNSSQAEDWQTKLSNSTALNQASSLQISSVQAKTSSTQLTAPPPSPPPSPPPASPSVQTAPVSILVLFPAAAMVINQL